MSSIKNIYVQLLPVLKSSKGHPGKILLVKWNHGNFANRWTGMIKATDMQASPPPDMSILKAIAKTLIPGGLPKIQSLDLMAILEFPDPPGCDEYVFVANLENTLSGESSPNSDPIHFDTNPCSWFELDKIPFSEMPADDELWYPQVLQGKRVRGSFTFGAWSDKSLKSYWVKEVSELNCN